MKNPAEQLKSVPLTILVPDLLRQFNKPTLLGKHGINLTKAEMDSIAHTLTDNQALPKIVESINHALYDLIKESLTLLKTRFNLNFADALKTSDISEVAEWETTADFLEIANHKSNGELRISAGASLMAFLGDKRAVEHLWTVITVDDGTNDVDAMIARRALSQLTHIDINAEDWAEQVQRTLSS